MSKKKITISKARKEEINLMACNDVETYIAVKQGKQTALVPVINNFRQLNNNEEKREYILSSRIELIKKIKNGFSNYARYIKAGLILSQLSDKDISLLLEVYNYSDLLDLSTLKPFNTTREGSSYQVELSKFNFNLSELKNHLIKAEDKKTEANAKKKATAEQKKAQEREKIEKQVQNKMLRSGVVPLKDVKTLLKESVKSVFPKTTEQKLDKIEQTFLNGLTKLNQEKIS